MPIIGTTNSILQAGITITNPAILVFGQNTVAAAGTSERLVATSTPLKVGITVKALASNTTAIWIGTDVGANLSTTGFELAAGEQVFIPITDAVSITIDATTSTEGVSYIGN